MRFGTVYPKSRIPDAVVIGLPGLTEFAEKYFEIANEFREKNLSFWVLDWQGQGKSARHLQDRQKRFSAGFSHDVEDLHYFIMEYVKHSAVHPDVGRIPLVMLGHGIGANIGMRYLNDHPDIFSCAAFTAPMFGLNALKHLPSSVNKLLFGLLKTPLGASYALGCSDWQGDRSFGYSSSPFSSDPVRDKISDVWFSHDPDLQVGGVTYKWVYEALHSCACLQKKGFLESINIPCITSVSGIEKFVDNGAILSSIKRLSNCTLLDLPESRHDVLMERDAIRDKFMDAFYELIKTNVLDKPESLKPF